MVYGSFILLGTHKIKAMGVLSEPFCLGPLGTSYGKHKRKMPPEILIHPVSRGICVPWLLRSAHWQVGCDHGLVAYEADKRFGG